MISISSENAVSSRLSSAGTCEFPSKEWASDFGRVQLIFRMFTAWSSMPYPMVLISARGDTMPGTVGQCKDYLIVLPAEEIKITAYNILWFIKDETVREAFPDVEIFRKEVLLYMTGIVVASLNFSDCQFDLFIN